MKILLSGVETNNKGAELMLYAILQEIERRYPNATVYIPYSRCRQGLDYVKTNLRLRYTPFNEILYTHHIPGIFKRLHLPMSFYYKTLVAKGADYFLDGSGFAFGDQWDIDEEQIYMWNCMLRTLHSDGCKIVFMPQAFGPIEKGGTKKILSVINQYATAIMPREKVSYDYVKNSHLIDMNKVKLFPDFTALVDGEFPKRYELLKNGVCIIPNMKMIIQKKISYDNYVNLISTIITESRSFGRPVYLLNHGGNEDEKLANMCKESIGGEVEVVTGLNALEVKGLVATAYMVVTSRFHGLASALNSGVPSLATSWSHKYEELFKDYEQNDCVLPVNDLNTCLNKIHAMLGEEKNARIRKHLELRVKEIKIKNRDMWNFIWNYNL